MTAPGPAPEQPEAPGSHPLARFAADLAALWPHPADAKLGVAVSGGPDSIALLLLAAAALPGAVEAATVDHGLRPEAAGEAAQVAALCARLDVPHATLVVTVAPGNLQAQARAVRYAALAGWLARQGLAALATAHHADDQAETLLLRLNRASGVAGLAGTRAAGTVPDTQAPLLRPLLGWRRAELAQVVAGAGVGAADDPSNRDERFDRVRIRKALAGADWLDVAAMATSARHLADADEALEWAAAREWRACVREEALGWHYRRQAPRAIALRVVARIVELIDGHRPRGGAAARLVDALEAGGPGMLGNVVARVAPGGWSFSRAPRRAPRADG